MAPRSGIRQRVREIGSGAIGPGVCRETLNVSVHQATCIQFKGITNITWILVSPRGESSAEALSLSPSRHDGWRERAEKER